MNGESKLLTLGVGRWVAAAALTLGGAALVFELGADPARAWGNLLIDGFFFLSLSLGALFFLALQYVTRAGWGAALKRVPEAMADLLIPAAAVMALVLTLGRHHLYPWTHAEEVAHEPLLAAKTPYLNEPFFLLRMAVILAVWVLFAVALRRASLAQDDSSGLGHQRRLVRLSAVFLVVFAFSLGLASFDWLMSLEPEWFSTIFAVYTFAGVFQGALAALILAVVVLAERGPLAGIVRPDHLHDLGKLLFAFSTFWAYIWLSQYLLIWYSNLPEEATWYVLRTGDAWRGAFYLCFFLSWVVPFFALMARAPKRNPRVLTAVAVIVLCGHWLDLYLQVMPPRAAEARPGLTEILLFAAFAALFLLLFARRLGAAPLVARRDPYLAESLGHHS